MNWFFSGNVQTFLPKHVIQTKFSFSLYRWITWVCVDFHGVNFCLFRLGSLRKEHDPRPCNSYGIKFFQAWEVSQPWNQWKYKKKLAAVQQAFYYYERACVVQIQYHLLDAWRNSLDPAPKIGLLIAEEEGQNLSKSFMIHQVSIRYRTTQRCQRCFVSFSLLQSGSIFLLQIGINSPWSRCSCCL